MCAVSMIGDHYRDKWWPNVQPPSVNPWPPAYTPFPEISRSEFDALKKEVEELKALLKRAKKYDRDNNEPNCEVDEKMELLRKVAEQVGVDLNDALK